MFHELSLKELDSLVSELRNILFENYKEVKAFNLENPEYTPNHPSGNWYGWIRSEEDRIKNQYGDLNHVRLFIDALNENRFDRAESYYDDVMKIRYFYNCRYATVD